MWTGFNAEWNLWSGVWVMGPCVHRGNGIGKEEFRSLKMLPGTGCPVLSTLMELKMHPTWHQEQESILVGKQFSSSWWTQMLICTDTVLLHAHKDHREAMFSSLACLQHSGLACLKHGMEGREVKGTLPSLCRQFYLGSFWRLFRPGLSARAVSLLQCSALTHYCTVRWVAHSVSRGAALRIEHVRFDRFITRLWALFSTALGNPLPLVIAGAMFMHEERLFDWAIVGLLCRHEPAPTYQAGLMGDIHMHQRINSPYMDLYYKK